MRSAALMCKRRRSCCSLIRIALLIGGLINVWIGKQYLTGSRVSNPDITCRKESPSRSYLIFYAANDDIEKEISREVIPNDKISNSTCEIPVFDPKAKRPQYGTCKRRTPIEGSCEEARRLFLTQPKPSCDNKKILTICQLHKKHSDSHYAECDDNDCPAGTSLGLINPDTGTLVWTNFDNATTLEATINALLATNSSGGNYGFCFVKCTWAPRFNPIGSQLLLLPQYYAPNSPKEQSLQDQININVIWLDSTSHSHFFRSLPKSVETLRHINKDHLANVFNYDLMQSMEGGTFRNALALTRGNFEDGCIGDFFSAFHDNGYHVTYMDDQCWTSMLEKRVIGIPKLFGLPGYNTYNHNMTKMWEDIQNILTQKGVDQIGISLANCESMTHYKNIFGSKSSRGQCYNGRFYTDHILEYFEVLQTQLHLAKRPYFNFLDLNTAHEPSGRRIQSLDNSLANFITHTSKLTNTITLMFGDHGLKYGDFMTATSESYYEGANPVFFVVASKDLNLQKVQLDALAENQDRLTDIIDIRQTLYTLGGVKHERYFILEEGVDLRRQYGIGVSGVDTHPNGLLHPISPSRTCKTLGIKLESNKCICGERQSMKKISNGTRINLLAEYALGELNNAIQEQFMYLNKSNSSGFGSCQRLVGRWIDNVYEQVIGNVTTTEMEVHIPAGSNAPQTEDTFHVIVQVTSNSSSGRSIELVYFLRTSSYGVYDECRDRGRGDLGVDRTLCVCSAPFNKPAGQLHLNLPNVFGAVTTVVSLNKHLFVFERRSKYGVVLEASCDDEQELRSAYELVVSSNHTANVATSKGSPFTVTINSGMKVFLDLFYQLNTSTEWRLEYEVSFRQLA